MKTEGKWVPFYFEGGMFWDMIQGPEDWQKLLKVFQQYSPYTDPREAKQHHKGYHKFGFYPEYTGEKTLKEWALEVGINLSR